MYLLWPNIYRTQWVRDDLKMPSLQYCAWRQNFDFASRRYTYWSSAQVDQDVGESVGTHIGMVVRVQAMVMPPMVKKQSRTPCTAIQLLMYQVMPKANMFLTNY